MMEFDCGCAFRPAQVSRHWRTPDVRGCPGAVRVVPRGVRLLTGMQPVCYRDADLYKTWGRMERTRSGVESGACAYGFGPSRSASGSSAGSGGATAGPCARWLWARGRSSLVGTLALGCSLSAGRERPLATASGTLS